MKSLHNLILLLVVTFSIYGCGPATPSAIWTQTKSLTPSPTIFPTASSSISATTETLTPSPQSPTTDLTLTPPIPLRYDDAKATIQALLREPVDCAAPCFWGIVPGQTMLGEARNVFAHFGLRMKNTTFEGKRFSSASPAFLSLEIILTMQDNIVMNLRVKMIPEEQNAGVPRAWLAYSPETLINRYGQPSRVILALDKGPNLYFEMGIYFDELDLIVLYAVNSDYPEDAGPLEVCPLTAQFDYVALWMGKDPIYPPLPGVPLERATGMTVEEFSKLMIGDPDKACFILKEEEFIQ